MTGHARQHIGLILAAMAVAGLPLLAPLIGADHPLIAAAVRGFFGRLCHQHPDRSFRIHGASVAVCVRCLGIYFGVAWAAVSSAIPGLWRRMPANLLRFLFLAALLLNGLDVTSEVLGLHGNLPGLRFFFGLLLGLAAGALLLFPQGEGKRKRSQAA